MMQLDLDQPPGQQPGGRERGRVEHLYRELPGLVGQPPGDVAEGHRRVGQVGYEFLGRLGGAPLDVIVPGVLAVIGGALLPGPGADQHIAHRVSVPGQVGQDMGPRPARQQRRRPQVRLGQHPGAAEQALRRVVDLVTELTSHRVHPPTVKRARPRR